MKPAKSTWFFIVAASVLLALYASLLNNLSNTFDDANRGYKTGEILNLDADIQVEELSEHLLICGYFKNAEDAFFAAQQIIQRLQDPEIGLEDLYNISYGNKWHIPSRLVDSIGSKIFRNQLELLRGTDTIDSQRFYKISENSETHQGHIKVLVNRKLEKANALQRFLKRDLIPCRGIAVRLIEHHYDADKQPVDSCLGFLYTDSTGCATFDHLDMTKSYSVLPVSRNFSYGAAKGTIAAKLGNMDDGKVEFEFTQRELALPIASAYTVKQMKEDISFTVRTPDDYVGMLSTCFFLVFAAWSVLYILLTIWSIRKGIGFARSLITCMMFLTSVSVLMMFAMGNPLTDRLRGDVTANGVLVGVVMVALLCRFNVIKFFQGKYRISFDPILSVFRWLFSPYKEKCKPMALYMRSGNNKLLKMSFLIGIIICFPFCVLDVLIIPIRKLKKKHFNFTISQGTGYALLAILLTCLLFVIGSEVGGMKVNLDLGFLAFQPSEIAKYLIVIFLAAYFCLNETIINHFSQPGNGRFIWRKLRMMFVIFGCLAALMFLYMLLGDMGPALVIAITFIIVYSAIKSKIVLQRRTDKMNMHIFTCDFAYLVYGIVSFAFMLLIGSMINCIWVFATIWFTLWIGGFWLIKRQVIETPVMFNFVVSLFIFGGGMFKWFADLFNLNKLHVLGERLDSRIEMCLNTWGNLGLNASSGGIQQLGENSQIAEGLWALASGGLQGQGLGRGLPNLVPAYHTDMILSSIGENMGFFFLLVLIVVVSVLLKKTLNVGYCTGNRFGFFLAMGIAMVTAVQYFIIMFGSTGFIPLTGVTVPFLSYGRVSMILNIMAFGVILSLSKKEVPKAVHRDAFTTTKYDYTVAVIFLVYLFLALFIVGIYLNYMLIQRDSTLIRPLYVKTRTGLPIIEYNPRIRIISKQLFAGNIYDRNGILLATSNTQLIRDSISQFFDTDIDVEGQLSKKQMRYYPFGMHTFFMLGDLNNSFLSSGVTRGYNAEIEHLSYLRGYDNRVLDKNGRIVKMVPKSNKYYPSRFLEAINQEFAPQALYDYTPLIPILKSGIHCDRIEEINKKEHGLFTFDTIRPKDLSLTIDVKLQVKLQQRIAQHISQYFSDRKYNKLRVSTVILDANDGDLLASANYPLPDEERLHEELEMAKMNNTEMSYRDYNRSTSWKAYTDMDLGLFYYTAPGSTAKVVTSMAGLQKQGKGVATDKGFYYDPIEKVGLDPKRLEYKTVSMDDAITWSSNNYVIKLLNTYDLYSNLAQIYSITGMRVNYKSSYNIRYTVPLNTSGIYNEINKHKDVAVEKFNYYNETKKERRKNLKNVIGSDPLTKHHAWQWAWGQGTLDATPLAMARIVSIVVNDGAMPITRYTLNDDKIESITVVSDTSAVNCLKEFMKHEAIMHSGFMRIDIGGKTGTPERELNGLRNNDGWYICFIENSEKTNSKFANNVAIAVRLERINGAMSGSAVKLTKEVVVPVLREFGYVK